MNIILMLLVGGLPLLIALCIFKYLVYSACYDALDEYFKRHKRK